MRLFQTVLKLRSWSFAFFGDADSIWIASHSTAGIHHSSVMHILPEIPEAPWSFAEQTPPFCRYPTRGWEAGAAASPKPPTLHPTSSRHRVTAAMCALCWRGKVSDQLVWACGKGPCTLGYTHWVPRPTPCWPYPRGRTPNTRGSRPAPQQTHA